MCASPIRPASCFPAPGCALLQRQFNAVFAPAVGLKQQKPQHTENRAVQDESENNARPGHNPVRFVLRLRVYRNPDKPAVGALVALPAGMGEVVFIYAGFRVLFFKYIVQRTGSMTAKAVGRLTGAQLHQFTVYRTIIGFHGLQCVLRNVQLFHDRGPMAF